MDSSHQAYHQKLEDIDNQPDHSAGNKTFNDKVEQGRRRFMKGGLGMAVVGFIGGSLTTSAKAHFQAQIESPRIGFKSLPPQLDPGFDAVAVPDGYTAQVFFSWGDSVESGATLWRSDASNSWQEQMKQAGQNHDGIWFFPFQDRPNHHGLLVMNHEYINPTLHPDGLSFKEDSLSYKLRPEHEVKKEMAAHGVSIIEVRKNHY